jgi:hypothetical protein
VDQQGDDAEGHWARGSLAYVVRRRGYSTVPAKHPAAILGKAFILK